MSKPFALTITAEDLTKGLRSSARSPRNSKYLVESKGAVGCDGVLAAINELTRMNTSGITDVFPFPQIFVFTNMTIVCSSTKIYEWINDALVEQLEVTAGSTWSAVDFYDYAYLSNGKVAVIRDAGTGDYSITTDLPAVNCMLNYNGQVIVGAPEVTVIGASLSIVADVLTATLSQHGSWV